MEEKQLVKVITALFVDHKIRVTNFMLTQISCNNNFFEFPNLKSTSKAEKLRKWEKKFNWQ